MINVGNSIINLQDSYSNTPGLSVAIRYDAVVYGYTSTTLIWTVLGGTLVGNSAGFNPLYTRSFSASIDSIEGHSGLHMWIKDSSLTSGGSLVHGNMYRFIPYSAWPGTSVIPLGATYRYLSTFAGDARYTLPNEYGSAIYKGETSILMYRVQNSGMSYIVQVFESPMGGGTPIGPSNIITSFVPGASILPTNPPIRSISRVGKYLFMSMQREGTSVGMYYSYINNAGQYSIPTPFVGSGLTTSNFINEFTYKAVGTTLDTRFVFIGQNQLTGQSSPESAVRYDNFRIEAYSTRVVVPRYASESKTAWVGPYQRTVEGSRVKNISSYTGESGLQTLNIPYNQDPELLNDGSVSFSSAYKLMLLEITPSSYNAVDQISFASGATNPLNNGWLSLDTRGSSYRIIYRSAVGNTNVGTLAAELYAQKPIFYDMNVISFQNFNNNTFNLNVANTDVT